MFFHQRPDINIYILAILFGLGLSMYIYLVWKKAKQINTTAKRLWVKALLRITYFILALIALLGPIIGFEKKEVKVTGKDIYLLIDVSNSMDATDVQPTRLEKVKYEAKQLIEAFNDSRVGLAVFSADAALQCPLTYDHNIVNDIFLKSLNTNILYSGGTDFKKALSLVHKKVENDSTKVNKRGKIVVLFSDGEHFGDSYKELVDEIKDDGIIVLTVGVGTDQGSNIPTRKGRLKLDDDGKPVVSKLKNKDLKYIAKHANGKYFEINNKTNQIPQLIAYLKSIKGKPQDLKTLDTKANKFVYFLWIVLILVTLDILITIRVIKI